VKTAFRRICALLVVAGLACLALPTTAFAQPPAWYSVTFFQNDSQTDQIIAGQQANAPASLTLFGNLSPNFANPGYTFNDWSTSFNGAAGSTVYADGAMYSFASVLSLYAQWTPDVYTLTYIPAGGTVTPNSVNYTVGSAPLTLIMPTLSGFFFDGWNSAANGSGTTFPAGGAYTPSSNVTLYAQWSADQNETISFSANGASGTIASATGGVGTSITLPSAASLTYAGHSFVGWNTMALGGGTNYLSASSLVVTSSITLYAQWTPMATVLINFSPNGGVGSVAALSGYTGASVTLPGATGISYVGHTFASWNTMASGGGTVFNVDGPLLLGDSMTLYAQWDALLVAKTPSVLIGAVGSFAINSATLTANLKTQIHRLAVLTKSDHFTAESLYGYTTATGSVSSQLAISNRRANAVAAYLRSQLRSLHVAGVTVTSAGEGTFKTETGATFRRVEIFVKG
jgi:uncharacterized repeat protein (TIGR02543 family)